jgi:hypothetical protein
MIGIIFDPHFWPHKRHGGPVVKGINRRAKLCLDTGERVVEAVNKQDAPLIVAGDLVDSAGPVSPAFAFALCEMLGRSREPVTLMLGNHDLNSEGDHALGIYTQHDDWTTVQVCEEIGFSQTGGYISDHGYGFDDDFCMVPFHRDISDPRVRDVPLVIGHFGVYDDSFPAWCKKAKGAWHVDALLAFMKLRNIKAICLGDWHQRRLWMDGKRRGDAPSSPVRIGADAEHVILQGGALCPTGFDNPGLRGYGTLAFWDQDAHQLSWQEIPGPRFCVARSDEEEQAVVEEARHLKHNLFLRRYYDGKRPEAPPGLEAYEALPAIVERAAVASLPDPNDTPQHQAQLLVSHWLETLPLEDHDFARAYMARLL